MSTSTRGHGVACLRVLQPSESCMVHFAAGGSAFLHRRPGSAGMEDDESRKGSRRFERG